MNAKEKMQERLDIFHKAISFEKPSRIPYVSNDWGWRFLDSDMNCTYSEIMSDFDKIEAAAYENLDRYPCDAIISALYRNNLPLSNALGGGAHVVSDSVAVVQMVDEEVFTIEDYEPYIENPTLTLWQKFFPRQFGQLTQQQIEDAVKASMGIFAMNDRAVKNMQEKYGMPNIAPTPQAVMPIDSMFVSLRGIKGLSIDMRRHPEVVEHFVEATKGGFLTNMENSFKLYDGQTVCGASVVFLVHSIMGRKQFEKYLWSVYKEVLDMAEKYDSSVYQFNEATVLRFADFYEDIPKGRLTIHLEQDDIFETRKRLPNIALAGGMPTSMLYGSTKEECVEYAKKLIDELGTEGGYIFSENKMMSYAADAKRENRMAVVDFVNNYYI